ncbi:MULTISPECIES: hypothetical protein [Amycolatopsis]|uniref:Uncharacterized protein n=1 Tax=Amycolatopsis thermalba TaxID=944492 RepID=A0ABY4P186_9PSEU|nr:MULTISPECIES: hypothetical protein [Amycolatopsis]OXM67113.1 hypothetical protein CF166_24685 [Amycolatopsis sp. KNN50.9b]UQS26094.1 hypothetical protein L1857_26410 [Amycolatopsis thermalba]
MTGRIERHALRSPGRLAVLATAHLCRRHRRSPETLVRVMCQARNDEAADRARTTLERAWHTSPLWREKIWHAMRAVLAAEADRNARDGRDLPWVVILALVDVRPGLIARYDQRQLREMLLSAVGEPDVPYVVAAARRALDRLPGGPTQPARPAPRRSSAPGHYRPGGTGTAGSGGFSTGGFTVHGV